jgi:MFS family permease
LSTSEAELGPRPGLSNVVDIVVAPNTAFQRLRLIPTWGWAFLVAALLAVAGTIMLSPALQHAIEVSLPAKLAAMPQIAKLPAERQQSVIATQMKFSKAILQFYWLFVPVQLLIIGLVQALLMTVANAISRGDGSFKKYFALSINVAVVGVGLASLVLGLIVMIRGASSFESQSAVMSVAPSLALVAPGVRGALAGFLGALNVFALWATALLALGMTRVGRISAPVAWTFSILMLLVAAAFGAWGAAQNG